MTRFAFAIPTRNATSTAKRALASLAFQSYPHWRAIVVDDCSTDGTAAFVEGQAELLGVADKVSVIRQNQRMWEVSNVLTAMDRIEDDEIVCRFDLDDYLCDLNALEIVAKAYDNVPDLDALWTAHRWFDDDGVTNKNISGPLPADVDPYVYPWVSSHLKTWRRSVSKAVPDANYRGLDGEYIKRAGDQAIYLPVLKLARKRLYCPVPTYAYRCDMKPETFQTDDARFQKDEAEFLRKRGFIR